MKCMTGVKRYDSLDIMKFILCFLVVAIHSNPLDDISPILNRLFIGIDRLAVPLFFIASGFFLFKRDLTKRNVSKYIKRIGGLYISWFIVSIPFTYYNRFVITEGTLVIKLFLFIKSFFFTSTFSGSWFLASSIFCAVIFFIVYTLFARSGDTIILVLSIVSSLLCAFSSGWGNLIDVVGLRDFYNKLVFYFANPYTSIIAGIPYFAMGKWFADNEDHVKMPPWTLTSLLLACLLFEVWFTYSRQLTYTTDSFFLLFPCAFCIFIIFLKMDVHLKNSIELRRISTIVFFSHFIWLFLIEFIEFQFECVIPNIVKYFAAVSLSLFASLIILSLSKRPKLSILKYLY